MKTNYLVKTLLSLLVILSGSLQAQTFCSANMIETAPASQFTDNGNGIVTDNKTGLQWMRCAIGQVWDGSTCTGTEAKTDWQSALTIAESNAFAGLTDWRLPNKKELLSIIEFSCLGPALNITIFPNASSSSFWTSSVYTDGTASAWVVSQGTGDDQTNTRDSTFIAIRLVRGPFIN